MLGLDIIYSEIDSLPVEEDKIINEFFEDIIKKYGYGTFHFSIDDEIAQWAEARADNTYRRIARKIRGSKIKYRIEKIIGHQSLSDGYYCSVYSY